MLRGSVLALVLWAALARNATNVVDGAAFRLPLQRHVASTPSFGELLWTAPQLGKQQKRTAVWEPAFPIGHANALVHLALPPVPVDFLDTDGLYATLFFGTPPQPVSVGIDLWSAHAFVVNHAIDGRPFYNHTTSSTYQPNGTHVQIDWFDVVEGVVSRDHVSIGRIDATADRIDVRDHPLVELQGPDDTIRIFGPNFRGAIGLGAGHEPTTDAPSLPRAMIDQGLLDRPEIGVSYSEHDPHLLFGGVDAAYDRSDFYYSDAPRGIWAPSLRGISVNGKPLVGDAGPAILSPWPFVIGPEAAIAALRHAVGAKDMELPCDGPRPDIVLQISGGFNVTLTKEDYVYRNKKGSCFFMFVATGETWQLGMPFLRNVYTVLEYGAVEGHERVGFANIKR